MKAGGFCFEGASKLVFFNHPLAECHPPCPDPLNFVCLANFLIDPGLKL